MFGHRAHLQLDHLLDVGLRRGGVKGCNELRDLDEDTALLREERVQTFRVALVGLLRDISELDTSTGTHIRSSNLIADRTVIGIVDVHPVQAEVVIGRYDETL